MLPLTKLPLSPPFHLPQASQIWRGSGGNFPLKPILNEARKIGGGGLLGGIVGGGFPSTGQYQLVGRKGSHRMQSPPKLGSFFGGGLMLMGIVAVFLRPPHQHQLACGKGSSHPQSLPKPGSSQVGEEGCWRRSHAVASHPSSPGCVCPREKNPGYGAGCDT